MIEAKTVNSSNENLFAGEKTKANSRINPALDRKGRGIKQSHADTWWLGLSKGDSQPRVLRDSYIKPLSIVHVMVAHNSVVSSNAKIELDSNADTYVVATV